MKQRSCLPRLLLVLAALAFIWGNSLLPASASELESERFLALVRPAVELIRRLLAALGHETSASVLVRKLAHFTEYAVLGALLYALLRRPDGGRRGALAAAGLCLAAAAVDEAIQFLAAGRGPALSDVLLDFSGACLGLLLAGLVRALRRRGRPAQ